MSEESEIDERFKKPVSRRTQGSTLEPKPLITSTYFQLVGNEVDNVSPLYRKMHLVFLVSASVSSYILVRNFQIFTTAMGNNCIMYSHLTFKRVNESYNSVGDFKMERSFHNTITIWGRELTCLFCVTVSLISCVVALIMFIFLCFIPQGGYTPGNVVYGLSWEIMLPFTAITATMFILVTFLFVTLNNCLTDFCEQFKQELGTSRCTMKINAYSLIFNKNVIDIYSEITLVNFMATWMFISWGGLLITFIIRMFRAADFKIIAYHLENVSQSLDDWSSSSESASDVEVDIKRRSSTSYHRRNAVVLLE